MGLFKNIKKGFKKIFKGIKKGFTKALAFVGKVAGSKWGKMLLLASSIFTGGMALAAGFQGFLSSTAPTFLGKFVAGAKGFMAGLAKPVAQAKKMLGGAEAAATIGQAATAAAGAAQTAAPQSVLQGVAQVGQEVGARLPGALQVPGQALTAGMEVAQQTATGPGGGWLSKAAGFASDFIKSEAGAGLISGIGKGMAAEQEQEFQDRYRKAWADPNNPFAKLIGEEGFGAETLPSGPATTPRFQPRSQLFGSQYAGGGAVAPQQPAQPIGG